MIGNLCCTSDPWPTLLIIANWWVRHRFRVAGSTAEPSSLGDSRPAMPYLVIGFACTGELWGRNKQKKK